MISRKDVIRMKIPYPSISSGLASTAHMYICRSVNGLDYEYVKCQTLKPYLITQNLMKHFIDENPDINRNPFSRTTRIDCDKTFCTHGVTYDDAMKTTVRPDVCDDLFDSIELELLADGYCAVNLPENELQAINGLIN